VKVVGNALWRSGGTNTNATAPRNATEGVPYSFRGDILLPSHLARGDERLQPENVFAITVAEKPQAFARAIVRLANPDVIQRSQPGSVQGEPSAADLAGDFVHGVEGRFLAAPDAENSHSIHWRSNHSDGALRF
jgi:hypothetical protein